MEYSGQWDDYEPLLPMTKDEITIWEEDDEVISLDEIYQILRGKFEKKLESMQSFQDFTYDMIPFRISDADDRPTGETIWWMASKHPVGQLLALYNTIPIAYFQDTGQYPVIGDVVVYNESDMLVVFPRLIEYIRIQEEKEKK